MGERGSRSFVLVLRMRGLVLVRFFVPNELVRFGAPVLMMCAPPSLAFRTGILFSSHVKSMGGKTPNTIRRHPKSRRRGTRNTRNEIRLRPLVAYCVVNSCAFFFMLSASIPTSPLFFRVFFVFGIFGCPPCLDHWHAIFFLRHFYFIFLVSVFFNILCFLFCIYFRSSCIFFPVSRNKFVSHTPVFLPPVVFYVSVPQKKMGQAVAVRQQQASASSCGRCRRGPQPTEGRGYRGGEHHGS